MKWYHQFLLAFSGGHPRTIERITMEFLKNITLYLKENRYKEYGAFIENLLLLSMQAIHGSLLTHDKVEALLELRNHEFFGKIKEWIINSSHDGFHLGFPPGFGKIDKEANEIQDLVYDLMNLGWYMIQKMFGTYYYKKR